MINSTETAIYFTCSEEFHHRLKWLAMEFSAQDLNLAISLKGPPIPHPTSRTCDATTTIWMLNSRKLNVAELLIALYLPTYTSRRAMLIWLQITIMWLKAGTLQSYDLCELALNNVWSEFCMDPKNLFAQKVNSVLVALAVNKCKIGSWFPIYQWWLEGLWWKLVQSNDIQFILNISIHHNCLGQI